MALACSAARRGTALARGGLLHRASLPCRAAGEPLVRGLGVSGVRVLGASAAPIPRGGLLHRASRAAEEPFPLPFANQLISLTVLGLRDAYVTNRTRIEGCIC